MRPLTVVISERHAKGVEHTKDWLPTSTLPDALALIRPLRLVLTAAGNGYQLPPARMSCGVQYFPSIRPSPRGYGMPACLHPGAGSVD